MFTDEFVSKPKTNALVGVLVVIAIGIASGLLLGAFPTWTSMAATSAMLLLGVGIRYFLHERIRGLLAASLISTSLVAAAFLVPALVLGTVTPGLVIALIASGIAVIATRRWIVR